MKALIAVLLALAVLAPSLAVDNASRTGSSIGV